MGMIRFKAPALPLPTNQYEPNQQNQLLRALRLYFNNLDSLTPIQAEYFKGRGDQLIQPYAMLMSNQDQGSAGVTSENLIKFDLNVLSNGITVEGANDTEIHVPYPGQYLVTMRLNFANRGNSSQEIEVWAKDAGVNYPLSNTRYDIAARKSLSVYSHTSAIKTGIFTVDDPQTEYLEMAWWSDGADIYLEHYAAGTSPIRPEIPSVILTINLISAIP